MGAELIATWFWSRNETLNVEAAREVVNSMTDDEWQTFWEQVSGGDYYVDWQTDAREMMKDHLTLMEQVSEDVGSDQFTFVIPSPDGQWVLWIAGGTSWGDDPCEEFTAFCNVSAVRRVMTALTGDQRMSEPVTS